MEFIIVTGVSGSGKSCVVKALEDIGFDIQPTRFPKSNFATAESIYNMCKNSDSHK